MEQYEERPHPEGGTYYALVERCPHCTAVLRESQPAPLWKPPPREEVLAYRAHGEEHPALRDMFFKPLY